MLTANNDLFPEETLERMKKDVICLEVEKAVQYHFKVTNKVKPSPWTGLLFTLTELAEAAEEVLKKLGPWNRNNPERHGEYDNMKLAEELGDVIMMALISGYVIDVDPLRALLEKMERKNLAHKLKARGES